jgi:hypothetical protein
MMSLGVLIYGGAMIVALGMLGLLLVLWRTFRRRIAPVEKTIATDHSPDIGDLAPVHPRGRAT